MIDVTDLLERLTAIPAPSGFEKDIADAICAEWQPLADEVSVDRMGNVIALKKGKAPEPRRRVMIAAHMDEIGLLVRGIEEHNGYGFLRITELGGVDTRHLYGQQVTVHGRYHGHYDLIGVLGGLPAHLLPEEERKKVYDFENLFVDTGLPIDELQEKVTIGDYVSFKQPLRRLLGSRVTGKSFDNRAAVTAVTLTLEHLARHQHEWDLLAVATVQEESGLIGARTGAFAQQPDVALAIDVTFGMGPGASDTPITFKLGEGVTIGLGPHLHEGVSNHLNKAADTLEMTVHTETHVYHSGTDATAMQTVRAGIPTGLVSIPMRYMHTMVESLDTKDIVRAGRLMAEFVASLDDSFLETIAQELMDKDEPTKD